MPKIKDDKDIKLIARPWLLEIEEVSDSYEGEGIYILEFETGVKIGRSNNLAKRIKANQYKAPWCQGISKMKMYKTKLSAYYERLLKERFKDYCQDNSVEYFSRIATDDVIKFIENLRHFKKA